MKHKIFALLLICMLIFCSVPSWAATWYVKFKDGNENVTYFQDTWGREYNAANWDQTASTDVLTNLINNIVDDGDSVYISAGHFKLSSEITLTTKRLNLYGGFLGIETGIDDRDFTKNETILDAQKESGRGIFDVGTSSCIDGFTITGGKKIGVINITATPIIRNCNVKDNIGRIFNISGTPTITNCNITSNDNSIDQDGEGIVHISTSSKYATSITNCKISDNKGNGIQVLDGFVTIEACKISNNVTKSYSGAGISILYDTNVKIVNCCIENNYTGGNGGGIFINHSNGARSNHVTVSNCTINNNQAKYNGGGIFNDSNTTDLPEFINCTIAGNSSQKSGGGVYLNSGPASFFHCSFVNNTAQQEGYEIYTATANYGNNFLTNVNNSLFWNESAENIIFAGGNIRLDHCAFPKDYKFKGGNIPINYHNYNPTFISDWTPVSSEATVSGVTHTVYTLENNPALSNLKGKGTFDAYVDQLGKLRNNPSTIGAIEFETEPKLSSLNVGISAERLTLDIDNESEAQCSFSTNVSGNYDNNTVQKLKDYTVSWKMSVTPKNDKIEFSNGVLTLKKSSTPGNYVVKVSATVSSGNISKTSAPITMKINITEAAPSNNNPAPVSKDNEINNTIPTSQDKSEIVSPDIADTVSNDNDGGYSDEMNFSGNVEVKSLSLRSITAKIVIAKNCTNLESIDIAGNTSIQYLDITNTKISSLNVSGCTNLQTLILSQTKVCEKTFSFNGCVNLKTLILDQCRFSRFNYDENILPNLEELSCANQYINDSWTPSETFDFDDINSESVAAAEAENYIRFANVRAEDSSGNKLKPVSFNPYRNEMKFGGIPAKITYDYDTGFVDDEYGNYYMNVAIINSSAVESESVSDTNLSSDDVSNENSSNDVENENIASSGAGCNFGFSLLVIALFACYNSSEIHSKFSQSFKEGKIQI